MRAEADVLVLGAGAAGLTAAIFAAEGGAAVAVLEKTPMAGRKILMSGGTRCNVLPVVMDISDYTTSSSVNRLKNVFKSWSLPACHRWFTEEVGLAMETEAHSNKWFPKSHSAKEVRDLLLAKAERVGARFYYRDGVKDIRAEADGRWAVQTQSGQVWRAPKVIMATGGLSVPTTGTEGDGHRILQAMGTAMETPYPALTPLKGPHPGQGNLAGVSLDVGLSVWSAGKKTEAARRLGFLFTHRGFSGPAVLDVSHEVVRGLRGGETAPELRVDWANTGAEYWEERLKPAKALVVSRLKDQLPERLAAALMTEAGVAAGRTLADLPKAERRRLVELLSRYPLGCTGHEGYPKAEVTGGGVRLEDVDTATMELKGRPGLYVCGEIVDVFGRIGGFNFYWAWVSGRLAGKGGEIFRNRDQS